MRKSVLQQFISVLPYLALPFLANCAGKISDAEKPRTEPIPETKPPQCVFYLPGPDTSQEGGDIGIGYTGTNPEVKAEITWAHKHGYYTYYGSCAGGPKSQIGGDSSSAKPSSTAKPSTALATGLANTNNDVSEKVKKVKEGSKKGSVAKKPASQVLLEASQFYASVNKLADLKPATPGTPPASQVIQQLRRDGTQLGTETLIEQTTSGTFPIKGEQQPQATPPQETGTEVTITPTPAPKIPSNPKAIEAAAQSIIQKADSLVK